MKSKCHSWITFANLTQSLSRKTGIYNFTCGLTLCSSWSLVHRRRRGRTRRALTSSCRFLSTLCLWRSRWVKNGTLTWSSGRVRRTKVLELWGMQRECLPAILRESLSLTMGCPGSENFTLISSKCLRMGSSCSCKERKAKKLLTIQCILSNWISDSTWPALYNMASRWRQILILPLYCLTYFQLLLGSHLDEPTCSMSLSRSTFLKTVNQNSGMPLGSSFSSSFFSSSNLAFSFISSCSRETFPLQK